MLIIITELRQMDDIINASNIVNKIILCLTKMMNLNHLILEKLLLFFFKYEILSLYKQFKLHFS